MKFLLIKPDSELTLLKICECLFSDDRLKSLESFEISFFFVISD